MKELMDTLYDRWGENTEELLQIFVGRRSDIFDTERMLLADSTVVLLNDLPGFSIWRNEDDRVRYRENISGGCHCSVCDLDSTNEDIVKMVSQYLDDLGLVRAADYERSNR